MKSKHVILVSAALVATALAQAPAPPPVIIEERVIETVPVNPTPETEVQVAERRLNAAMARERLGIAPVVLPAADPGVVETTVETTTVEKPGQPTRVYSTERNVVLVEGRELPYLTLPVLFVEGTADLLDVESRLAIEDTSAAIKDVLAANPAAVFDVEGHTSTDGSDEMNMTLSADRSRSIYTELIKRYGVPASALAAHGYGENFPKYPDGTEEQMVLDRRVLVVRVK
jgi:outer membrane protein OmpA-like peptidoglycan-associated protein